MKVLAEKYADRDDVIFLGIHSAGTGMAQVKKLQKSLDWTLPTALDVGEEIVSGAMARAYGVTGWPNIVVLDREGKFAYNQSIEQWTKDTVLKETARAAKAVGLPELNADDSEEEQIAWLNKVNTFQLCEQIDKVLKEK